MIWLVVTERLSHRWLYIGVTVIISLLPFDLIWHLLDFDHYPDHHGGWSVWIRNYLPFRSTWVQPRFCLWWPCCSSLFFCICSRWTFFFLSICIIGQVFVTLYWFSIIFSSCFSIFCLFVVVDYFLWFGYSMLAFKTCGGKPIYQISVSVTRLFTNHLYT